MSDIGKAVYLACSALLFIFAATASIYLYTTLNAYLDEGISLSNVYNRAEGQKELATNETQKAEKRKIGASEVLITITNMDQMHVTTVYVETNEKTFEFSIEDEDSEEKIKGEIKKMGDISGKTFSYSYSSRGQTVTYTEL